MLAYLSRGLLLSSLANTVLSYSVQTTSGSLTGIADCFSVQFLGIKYGEAERFASSTLVETPNSQVLADTLPPFCPQEGQNNIAEDCLFLNVYVPHGNLTQLPVMVWLHGGSFQQGGSADPTFNGSRLAHEQEVIVVTLNYRLGTLGFYLDDLKDPTPAITDVVTALHWVKSNIGNFGGSDSSITLFGESSGATLVRAVSTSASLSDFFSKSIIESDPELGYEISPQQALNSSKYVLEANNVTSTSELKQRSVAEIIQSDQELPEIGQLLPDHSTFFNPWVDGIYVAGQFTELASEGKIPSRDFLIGTVKNESAAALTPLALAASAQELPSNVAAQLLGQAFGNDPILIEKILSNPTLLPSTGNDSHSELNEVVNLSILATKVEFDCPTALNAKYLRKSGNNVYLFRFDEGIRFSANEGAPLCSQPSEVCHEDDLNAVFGNVDPDSSIGLFTRKAWADFAKTATPGWNLLDVENEQLYSIGTGSYLAAGENDEMCKALYQLQIYH